MFIYYVGLFILIVSIIAKYDDVMLFVFTSVSSDVLVFDETKKATLLVGVLSAQYNFRARKVIRETWGQLTKNRSIELKFLIGDEVCPYPVKDRITPFGCDLWLINHPPESEEFSTMGDPIEEASCDIGFTFLVKTGIIINKIGLDYQIFKGNSSERARVVLYDSRLGSRVASATFVKEPLNGIFWKSVLPIILDEGFEGELKVISSDIGNIYCAHRLQYIAPVYYFETIDEHDKYVDFKLGNWRSTLVGFNYTLKDVKGLGEILADRTERFRRWSLEKSLIKQQLEDEQIKHNDLLFLSGFVDVYDNLSFKVSAFFKWVMIEDHWKYVLKTDDDVFLDLALIEKGLKNEFELWTCLRSEVPNHSGKWRDRYSSEYPLFPSGSGYVLSLETIKKLRFEAKSKLGEDVMMGYAIEDLKKPTNETCFWACGPLRANSPECNVPELSSNELVLFWNLYKEFGYIPNEDEI
ncbi:unnamed protein product [Nezara viridula]|uniref:Hexosyltransferase n=1 Tax=Nezara viridula TaxID=85310 RepID=A0A9P0HT09_NEZVI|nr:unnamed protein product [Nezara viridula]